MLTRLFLFIALFLNLVSSAFAYDASDNKLYYDYMADGLCYSFLDKDAHTVKVSGTLIRDDYAFDKTKNFSFHIPAEVTINGINYKVAAVGSNAFRNCVHLDSVEIPSSVTFIGSSAFAYCPNLKVAVLTDSITEIDDHAFSGCPIDTIAIPSKLQFLGIYAFENCQNLKRVHLPKDLAEFGPTIFKDCTNLVAITVDDSSKTMCSMDGVLYDKRQLTLITCPEGRTSALIIPSTVAFVKSYFPTTSKLSCISCTSPTPPYMINDSKEKIPVSLFVPKRSVDAYQQHAFWSRFNIHPF